MPEAANRRIAMRELAPEEAVKSFAEVSLGYGRDEAIAEARRALGADLAPAAAACPFGVDVPQVVAALARGDFDAAKARIVSAHPWPAILGRWCAKYCERAHELPADGEPAFLSALERAAAEYGSVAPPKFTTRADALRVAILGAGSGGAAAAYRLRQFGHAVAVYDRLPVGGGMMASGYPNFRLPLDVVRAEIALDAWGAELHAGTELTRALFDELRARCDAVVIATGKVKEAELGVPGEEFAGVWDALELLRRVKLGGEVAVGRTAAVFGAGYTAQDASRVLARLGCDVHVYYRRSIEEMPVNPRQRERYVTRQAREGAPYVFQVAPVRILGRDGRVTGVACVRTVPGEPDASGRPVAVPLPGSEFEIACETVVVATGETLDVAFAPEDLLLTADGTIWVDPETHETNLPGVYAVGAAAAADNTAMAFASGLACAEAIARRQGMPPH